MVESATFSLSKVRIEIPQVFKRTYVYDNLRRDSLWKLSGSQGDVWVQANPIHVGASPIVQFQFVGEIGQGYQGDIAIDDIVFLNCQGRFKVALASLSGRSRSEYTDIDYMLQQRSAPCMVSVFYMLRNQNIVCASLLLYHLGSLIKSRC